MATSQGPRDPLPKWQIFERSYDEVIAALKHQDEKLNRTLTALAFLTAAGVALFLQLETERPRLAPVEFPEGGPSVTAVLFVSFLISVAIALVTALAAIGPGGALNFKSSRKPSLLYFGAIADDDDWDKRLRLNETTLTHDLATNFHAEALGIARRVNYKMARSRESGAFVQVAVVSLGLLGIFQARDLGLSTRWWIAAALLGVLLIVLPLWEALRMRHDKYAEVKLSVEYCLLIPAVAFAALLLIRAESADAHWPALTYAGGVLLLSRLALLGPVVAKLTLGSALAAGVAAAFWADVL